MCITIVNSFCHCSCTDVNTHVQHSHVDGGVSCLPPPCVLLVTVSLYLTLCSSLEQDGATALYSASIGGHTEVVKLLMKAKADTELQFKVERL